MKPATLGVTQYLRWTQLPLTGLRKLGYRPWGFSILFSSFLMFITCRDTRGAKEHVRNRALAKPHPRRRRSGRRVCAVVPFPCRRGSRRAPTDGRTPGGGSRTQPGCCSRPRPSPSSSWCHCNNDKASGLSLTGTNCSVRRWHMCSLFRSSWDQILLRLQQHYLYFQRRHTEQCNRRSTVQSAASSVCAQRIITDRLFFFHFKSII